MPSFDMLSPSRRTGRRRTRPLVPRPIKQPEQVPLLRDSG